MKILYNLNSNINIERKTPANFKGKEQLVKQITNPSKILSAVSAGTIAGIVSINNIDELKEFLSKQKLTSADGDYEEVFYEKNDIDIIAESYKKNPELVNTLVNMRTNISGTSAPRFDAIQIRAIVNESEHALETVKQLIQSKNITGNYTYEATDIINITNYYKKDPNFIKKIMDLKNQYSEGRMDPRFKKINDYTLLIEANEQNPMIVEELLKTPNLLAREIKDITKTFKTTEFFMDLKNSICKDKPYNPEVIRTLNKNIAAFQQPTQLHSIDQKKYLLKFFTETLPKDSIDIVKINIPEFDAKIYQIQMSLGLLKQECGETPKEQSLFIKNILGNKNSASDNILRNFDFAQYKKDGLPLKYSRNEFIKNINDILSKVNKSEQNIIMSHFGLIPGNDGFDGIIIDKPFNNKTVSLEAQEAANKIQKEIKLFTTENKVVTGNADADKILTSLVQGLPEFTSVIGKKQHGKHAYSVDIHTLKVLQSAMNHPLYNSLSDNSKMVLKFSILFHDLGKKGAVVDQGHAFLSANYADTILQKFPFKEDLKNRITDIVENHHWNEAYSYNKTPAHNIAAHCRYNQDIMIYEIFSKSDFENISDTFHLENTKNISNQKDFNTFMEYRMIPIYESFSKMRSQANFVFHTQILKNGKNFPVESKKINGEEISVNVLDLNKLNETDNLEEYGFAPGTTVENADFLVHATSELEETYGLLKNYYNKVALSNSLINKKKSLTVKSYGFIVTSPQANISIAHNENLSTGTKRGFQDFENILFLEENLRNNIKLKRFEKRRTFLRDIFLKNLKEKGYEFSETEFVILSNYITRKKYLTQINDIKIGEKLIYAKDIRAALMKCNQRMFIDKNKNNEVECYNPKIQGLFAKANSLEECPNEVILFAKKYNLPIILFPKEN